MGCTPDERPSGFAGPRLSAAVAWSRSSGARAVRRLGRAALREGADLRETAKIVRALRRFRTQPRPATGGAQAALVVQGPSAPASSRAATVLRPTGTSLCQVSPSLTRTSANPASCRSGVSTCNRLPEQRLAAPEGAWLAALAAPPDSPARDGTCRAMWSDLRGRRSHAGGARSPRTPARGPRRVARHMILTIRSPTSDPHGHREARAVRAGPGRAAGARHPSPAGRSHGAAARGRDTALSGRGACRIRRSRGGGSRGARQRLPALRGGDAPVRVRAGGVGNASAASRSALTPGSTRAGSAARSAAGVPTRVSPRASNRSSSPARVVERPCPARCPRAAVGRAGQQSGTRQQDDRTAMHGRRMQAAEFADWRCRSKRERLTPAGVGPRTPCEYRS